jgi:hypothetical protein
MSRARIIFDSHVTEKKTALKYTFKKIQDENYILLLPANRHWERFKFIIAFVDRRRQQFLLFLFKSKLLAIAILVKENKN